MPTWIAAGLWGFVAGSALIIGALVGYFAPVGGRVVAAIMGFGGGVLISAIAFNLMDEAFKRGGFTPVAVGFLVGALVYTAVNIVLAHRGARHRKRSGHQQREERAAHSGGGGLAIAVGSLLDDIPESIVIGVSLIGGGAVSVITVVAIFLSDVPEALSSAAGMKKAGRSRGYIFGLWGAITVVTGLSAVVGYVVFSHFSNGVIAATTAVAAGAILAMLADTMMPEAFQEAHDLAGIVTVLGFLLAFVLTKIESS